MPPFPERPPRSRIPPDPGTRHAIDCETILYIHSPRGFPRLPGSTPPPHPTPLSILERQVPEALPKLPVFPGFSDVAAFAATPPFTRTVHRIARTPYFHAEKMLNGVAPHPAASSP